MSQFANGPTFGAHSATPALDVAFSIHTDVDAAFYDLLYPEHEWYKIAAPDQIVRDVNAGATSYAYTVRDTKGAAAFISNGTDRTIPQVAQTVGAVQIPVAYAAVGAVITNEDARQYSFGFNGNLASDLGEAMRKACDNLTENTVIFGNADLDLLPWIAYPGIQVDTAATGASGQTEWSAKTGEEIISDVLNALVSVWEDSLGIHKPLDVFLPMEQYARLQRTPVVLGGVNLAVTALEYLKKNNIMTDQVGQELRITPVRYLKGAGAAGTDRMVVMERNKRNQCLPMPMEYTLAQPVPAPLAAELYAEMKIGSYHVRQPGSMRYVDGI